MDIEELSGLLDLSEDCYFIHDGVTILYANRAAHECLGKPIDHLNGKRLKQLISEEDIVFFKASDWQGNHVLYRSVHIDNGQDYLRSVVCAGKPFQWGKKRLYAFVLKQPFKQAHKRKEAMEVASRLSAGVAHELRNPLTTIKGFIQLYSEIGELSASQINIMNIELERIENIINDYVLLAEEPPARENEPIQMAAFLQSLLKKNNVKQLTDGYPIKLNISEEATVSGSRKEFFLLFYNLLENAIDASLKHSPVHITMYTEGSNVCVEITDFGSGIPAERLHYIGQPFYSTKEKGTGLGLMICYRVVETHGGLIDIESKNKSGTKVKVVLPMNTKNRAASMVREKTAMLTYG